MDRDAALGSGPDQTSPPGWYTDPRDGEQRYWDGQQWAPTDSGTMTPTTGSAQAGHELVAKELRRGAWWRFAIAVTIGSVVALIVLNSTTGTVLWWGGYLLAGSLAWGAVKRLRLAGDITGRGVGAGSWMTLLAGVGVVALLGFQAASYWTSPASPSSPTSSDPEEVVGSCWTDSAGDMVTPVDCNSSAATYKVTSTPSSAEYCAADYITMDDGTIACLSPR